ncbi:hypothetical protein HZC00_00335 [Candidatus Kaiserbacteria bacterium]|nr:hypothetical protein [Candidatus Kaiserbacteria bacterium]
MFNNVSKWRTSTRRFIASMQHRIRYLLNKMRHELFLRALAFAERKSGRFITFHTRPIYSKDIVHVADTLVHTPSCAIVLQGPILKKYDFTLETIRTYKKVYPMLTIILSTWEDEDPVYLEKIRDEGIEIVLNKKPAYNGPRNVNMQIVSARNGIKRAKDLGVPYVIKSRTDQRMYNKNIIETLYNLIQYFPPGERSKQNKRIIFGHNTPKYQPYVFSDIFIFGDIDDMVEYWDTDLVEKDAQYPVFIAEMYLAYSYLKRKGWPMTWSIQAMWEIYRECIITIDWTEIDLFWLKYDYFWERHFWEHKHRYNQKNTPSTDHLHFHDWFNIYSDMENKVITSQHEGFIRMQVPEKR